MTITIAAIHTASPMIETTKALVKEYLPENVRLINITDDSLIQEVIREGKATAAVTRRLMNYYYSAVDAGADIIFNTCSSVGEIASAARSIIPIPIVKIDDAMTRQAIENYSRIGVLATLASTLGPTVNLLKQKASQKIKEIIVLEGLAKGAFEALLNGDAEIHDNLILKTAASISADCEVLVLAQGSMARMQIKIRELTGKDILASPVLGILDLKNEVEKLLASAK